MALCLPLPFLFGFNSRSPYSTHGSPINPEVAREKKPPRQQKGKREREVCVRVKREEGRKRDDGIRFRKKKCSIRIARGRRGRGEKNDYSCDLGLLPFPPSPPLLDPAAAWKRH